MDFERLGECIKGGDIISSLPDDILVNILSRLNTDDSFKTCVLSSRWKNLWTFVYNLHFLYNRRNFVNFEKFENFVDRVLSLCQCKDIQQFCLYCSVVDDSEVSHVIHWLCFAVERKVRKLTISISLYNDLDELWFIRLPQSISTCNTLVELHILNDFVFDIPNSTMCFPSLKLLDISIRHLDGDFFQKLFLSCPVLEDLSIDGELDRNVGVVTFEIMVPTLKRLSIWLYMESIHFFEGVYNHKFVVTASNLEYLNFGCHLLPSFVVNGRLLLNEVSLDIRISNYVFNVSYDEDNRVMKLLSGVNYTKILSLTSSTTNSLNLGFDDNMPTFPNLIRLEMCMDARYGWKLLPHFLNSSNNLQVLILKMDCNQEYLLEQFVQFESGSVPCCLRLHLKTIEIRNMMGDEDVLEVISYMLKNSEVLEEFSVDIPNEVLRREILMYPRGSAACQIKFL